MRTAFLTLSFAISIALWGMAVYSDGAMAGAVPTDGYGVSLASN